MIVSLLNELWVVIGGFLWRIIGVFMSFFSKDIVVGFSLVYIVLYAWVIKKYFWVAFEKDDGYRRMLMVRTGMKSYYAVLSICVLLIVAVWLRALGFV